MKYWRAVCPANQYYPSAWVGWLLVSTERVVTASGITTTYHHLVKPRSST